jgi:5-methyltetrahydrofolate--homocysteine methyltransferase
MLLCDGAWTTAMQRMGLQPGECPEEWNVSHPDDIKQIARDYFAAGADFCITNTFGGTRYRLVRHGFADRVGEFNRAGFLLSQTVADEFGKFVAASIGPTGEFLEPEGMLNRREMLSAFTEQISALKDAGAGVVCIESMFVLDEAVLAIQAAKQAGLFCIASMTFDQTSEGYRTTLGTPVEEAIKTIDVAGADVVGTNCGLGLDEIVAVVRQMRPLTRKPILARPNATGGGAGVGSDKPADMAARIVELERAGANIIGGCCGTTPEYIAAFRKELLKRG